MEPMYLVKVENKLPITAIYFSESENLDSIFSTLRHVACMHGLFELTHRFQKSINTEPNLTTRVINKLTEFSAFGL